MGRRYLTYLWQGYQGAENTGLLVGQYSTGETDASPHREALSLHVIIKTMAGA
jgi:hypothetical protein